MTRVEQCAQKGNRQIRKRNLEKKQRKKTKPYKNQYNYTEKNPVFSTIHLSYLNICILNSSLLIRFSSGSKDSDSMLTPIYYNVKEEDS